MAFITALPALCGPRADAATGPLPELAGFPLPQDYTLFYWQDGPPRIMGKPQPLGARETLCFQSGSWGMVLDAKEMRVLRAGRFAVPLPIGEAMKPDSQALAPLPSVAWDCVVESGGVRFRCVGHMETDDSYLQPVRVVESGRYFHRVAIEGLRFVNAEGKSLACHARLEISAWPDLLAMRLEVEPEQVPANGSGSVQLRLGDRRVSTTLLAKTALVLKAFNDPDMPRPQLQADPALKAGFDEGLDCHTLALAESRWPNPTGSYYPPERLDRLDRWPLVLRNDSDHPTVARLLFTDTKAPAITGFTPMLCDADGTPTGLVVQISKDWHTSPGKSPLPHQGYWFHGFAFVRMPPRSQRSLVFQVVYARYGGVFAASLAQLSLIGWGHNGFWDQAAIGSFGESICFEPGRVQRRCFITDVRPFLTLPTDGPAKPWGWARNTGGGDLLMWQDTNGRYQAMRATRTEYLAYGPCLTHARYAEETVGGELGATVDVSLARGDDCLRVFVHLRYDVYRLMRWQRLAFLQLGADHYNETPSRRVAVGAAEGVHDEWEPRRAQGTYDRSAIPLTGAQPWVSIHGLDRDAMEPGSAATSRGLIVRAWKAVLNGRPAPLPCASFFCTEEVPKRYRTIVELAPPVDVKELRPGDFVDAQVELVVFPADASAYYGPNQSFREELTRDADTWHMIHFEASRNALEIKPQRGRIATAYPLSIEVDDEDRAEFLLAGGSGFVPLTFTGLKSPRGYALLVDDKPLNQSVHGNDFWQTDYDPDRQRWQLTFNLLAWDAARKIRLAKAPLIDVPNHRSRD